MTAPVVATAARAGAGASASGGAAAGGTTAAASKSGTASNLASGAGLGSMLDGKPSKAVPKSSARRFLVAEFTLCMAVLAFSPLADKEQKAAPFMKRASATMGLFFILAIISTAGKGASRAAAAFGGLVTLVVLISGRNILTVLTAKLGKGVGDDSEDMEGWTEAGEGVAGAIEDLAETVNELTPLPPGVMPTGHGAGAGML